MGGPQRQRQQPPPNTERFNQRSKLKHWTDADHNGCNTRAEVLKAEAVTAPEQGPDCRLTEGVWFSSYDDRCIEGPSGLDIDHLVRLAEAWDSGASTWTPAQREACANDLGDEIAVSAASNRSKADQDPSTRLPPGAGCHCTPTPPTGSPTRPAGA